MGSTKIFFSILYLKSISPQVHETDRVTAANTPCWDYAAEVRKNRRSGDNYYSITCLYVILVLL